jgi:glutamine cyclotransferase
MDNTMRLLAYALITLLPLTAFAQAPISHYKVVARLPHATSSYTEGLFFLDGLFYEGTGLNGHSALMAIEPNTGKIVQEVDLPRDLFGEGIVDWGPSLYQWTWQSHTGFIYDRLSLRRTGQFTYTGEGWGMTRTTQPKPADQQIITSDGSATLRFRDPATFKELRHIVVHDGKDTIFQLNELEFIKGEIYANVWHSDRIARISPEDGRVLSWIDLSGLLPPAQKIDAESVLNGIAYDPQHDRLFVTGKQWPAIFEIKLVP